MQSFRPEGTPSRPAPAVETFQNFYACDSEEGSSGSPIVDPSSGHVIALHRFGGITDSPCLNGGTEMPEICADAGPLLDCAGGAAGRMSGVSVRRWTVPAHGGPDRRALKELTRKG